MTDSTTTTTESTATDPPATTTIDEPTLESVCEQLETLTDHVKDLEAQVEQKDERIKELEAELTEYKRFVGSEFADVRGRITDVETQVDELETTTEKTTLEDTTDRTSPSTETPLERTCTLPEPVADRELTINQKRARFIARDIRDYAEKVPVGLVLDSGIIAKSSPLQRERSHTPKLWPVLWTSSQSSGKTTLSK